MSRLLILLVEVLAGLLLAGVVVGGLVPLAHGTIGPVAATVVAAATVVLVVAVGEAFRRKPTRP